MGCSERVLRLAVSFWKSVSLLTLVYLPQTKCIHSRSPRQVFLFAFPPQRCYSKRVDRDQAMQPMHTPATEPTQKRLIPIAQRKATAVLLKARRTSAALSLGWHGHKVHGLPAKAERSFVAHERVCVTHSSAKPARSRSPRCGWSLDVDIC